jgi:hypothetical protein
MTVSSTIGEKGDVDTNDGGSGRKYPRNLDPRGGESPAG